MALKHLLAKFSHPKASTNQSQLYLVLYFIEFFTDDDMGVAKEIPKPKWRKTTENTLLLNL
jgi:hypothetical protein